MNPAGTLARRQSVLSTAQLARTVQRRAATKRMQLKNASHKVLPSTEVMLPTFRAGMNVLEIGCLRSPLFDRQTVFSSITQSDITEHKPLEYTRAHSTSGWRRAVEAIATVDNKCSRVQPLAGGLYIGVDEKYGEGSVGTFPGLVLLSSIVDIGTTTGLLFHALSGRPALKSALPTFDLLISNVSAPIAEDCSVSARNPSNKLLPTLTKEANTLVVSSGIADTHRGAVNPIHASLSVGLPFLKPNGSVVVRATWPHPSSAAVKSNKRLADTQASEVVATITRDLKFRFLSVRQIVDKEKGVLIVASGAKPLDEVGCSTLREDFPGLLPKGQRRPKHWSRNEVPATNAVKKGFFMALQPRFSSAPHPDALQQKLQAEKKKRDDAAKREEAFQGVAGDLAPDDWASPHTS